MYIDISIYRNFRISIYRIFRWDNHQEWDIEQAPGVWTRKTVLAAYCVWLDIRTRACQSYQLGDWKSTMFDTDMRVHMPTTSVRVCKCRTKLFSPPDRFVAKGNVKPCSFMISLPLFYTLIFNENGSIFRDRGVCPFRCESLLDMCRVFQIDRFALKRNVGEITSIISHMTVISVTKHNLTGAALSADLTVSRPET